MSNEKAPRFRLTGARYCRPKKYPGINSARVKYENAEKMANEIEVPVNGDRIFAVIPGNFYFGDFLEALIVKHNWLVDDMTLSTLSMNNENIDSLANLLRGGFVKQLNLVISDYFYSHERHKHGAIPYMYETLDIDNKFQLAVAGVHTKIYMIKTQCGHTLTIHGSANMRTSDSVEQFMIESCPDLYAFNRDWHGSILDSYSTIKKSTRGKPLWRVVATEKEKAETKEKQKHPSDPRKEKHSILEASF